MLIRLRDISKKIHFDLFVLVLNNIFVYSLDNQSGENRIEKILDLMSEIKQLYDKPIIAMTGWPDDPEFESIAIEAGADHFFKLPFKNQQFQDAVISCPINQK